MIPWVITPGFCWQGITICGNPSRYESTRSAGAWDTKLPHGPSARALRGGIIAEACLPGVTRDNRRTWARYKAYSGGRGVMGLLFYRGGGPRA
jgi:hypothetical protein